MPLLIIQIPCLNEETTLPQVVADLPRAIPGIDRIELLIIDDGSTDRTIEVARALGVHHVVRFPRNRGLAAAFRAGLDACIRLGADYIVNTDGDNQYRGEHVARIVEPLIRGEADLVVGDRDPGNIEHFSLTKRALQRFGSAVVRGFSRTEVGDATSGFRAYSREAAMRLNLVNEYTYTLETIIQAGHANLAVGSVRVDTNAKTRESRLIKSIRGYVQRGGVTILRSYLLYRPLKSFLMLGSAVFAAGVALGLRFLFAYAQGQGAGKIQSVVLASALLVIGVQLVIAGMLADVVAANRKLTEDALVRLRRIEAATTPSTDPPAISLNPRAEPHERTADAGPTRVEPAYAPVR
jgi:glycosyltransferase involved in cell wall biosynthesis